VSHASRVFNKSVKTAERDSKCSEFCVLDNALGRLESVLHDERESSAISALHLRLGPLIVRRALQTRIGNTSDLRVLLEELSDLHSVLAVLLHAHSKCADSTEDKEGIEWAHNATSVLAPLADETCVFCCFCDDDSTDDIAVSVEVFCDAVEDNVSAEDERVLEDRRSEGVVDDEDSASLVGDLGDLAQVSHSSERISGSLDIDDLSLALLDAAADLLGVGSVDDGGLHAIAAEDVAKEVDSRSVHNLAADSMVTSLEEGEDSTRNSAHSRGKGNAVLAVLQLSNGHLKLLNSGIAHTRIDVALALLAKEISAHLRVVKDKGAGLEDREGVGMKDMLLVTAGNRLACSVDAKSVETFLRHLV